MDRFKLREERHTLGIALTDEKPSERITKKPRNAVGLIERALIKDHDAVAEHR